VFSILSILFFVRWQPAAGAALGRPIALSPQVIVAPSRSQSGASACLFEVASIALGQVYFSTLGRVWMNGPHGLSRLNRSS
jgi:hypothetical protein